MKVAAIAGLAALAACAAAPPERLRNPKRKKHPADDVASQPAPPPPASLPVFVPRPTITLPPLPPAPARNDPSELVRWPLSQATHPTLEPAFAIAKVFAQPGVSWIDLCARGVQNRRGGGIAEEHREYLTAWCEVLKRDAPTAVARLAPLMSTGQRGLPAAIRQDVANIVVDAGDADIAEDLLNRARIDDIAVYDLVAATYAEVGRATDALRFNDRALASSSRYGTGYCERGAREILLAHPQERAELIERFRRNSGCHSLADDLACWNDAKQCGTPRTFAHAVHEIHDTWPTSSRNATDWFQIGTRALMLFPAMPGADALAAAAFAATISASKCTDRVIGQVVADAAEIRTNAAHDPALDAQLDQIMWTPEQLCQR